MEEMYMVMVNYTDPEYNLFIGPGAKAKAEKFYAETELTTLDDEVEFHVFKVADGKAWSGYAEKSKEM